MTSPMPPDGRTREAPAAAPLVEMRDIRVSFGGVHAVERRVASTFVPARWSAWSAATAPGSPRS